MGSSAATVAVVMRTYERPVMLARALASVQQQTHRDFHLVVVNNGGEPGPVDSVVDIARQMDPSARISVLHLEDRYGMEAASNWGLAEAAGAGFFVIHDDDDSWHPRFLESTVAAMAANPDAVAVVTGVVKVHEMYKDGRVWPVRHEDFWLVPERLTFEGLVGNNTFPPIAALFRTSLLDTVGNYDASLPVLGDWEFNLRAVRAGRFAFVPERLANYHVRLSGSDVAAGNSITNGMDLHARIKQDLQQKWMSLPGDGTRSMGEMSVAGSAEMDALEERNRAAVHAIAPQPFVVRQVGRVLRGLGSPRRSAHAVVRRVRNKAGW